VGAVTTCLRHRWWAPCWFSRSQHRCLRSHLPLRQPIRARGVVRAAGKPDRLPSVAFPGQRWTCGAHRHLGAGDPRNGRSWPFTRWRRRVPPLRCVAARVDRRARGYARSIRHPASTSVTVTPSSSIFLDEDMVIDGGPAHHRRRTSHLPLPWRRSERPALSNGSVAPAGRPLRYFDGGPRALGAKELELRRRGRARCSPASSRAWRPRTSPGDCSPPAIPRLGRATAEAVVCIHPATGACGECEKRTTHVVLAFTYGATRASSPETSRRPPSDHRRERLDSAADILKVRTTARVHRARSDS
jgi:hypothetical protein